jgi:hypothetical protein
MDFFIGIAIIQSLSVGINRNKFPPRIPDLIIRSTAEPPEPPTPTTLILAKVSTSGLISIDLLLPYR